MSEALGRGRVWVQSTDGGLGMLDRDKGGNVKDDIVKMAEAGSSVFPDAASPSLIRAVIFQSAPAGQSTDG